MTSATKTLRYLTASFCALAFCGTVMSASAQTSVNPGAGPNGLPSCSQPLGSAYVLPEGGHRSQPWGALGIHDMPNTIFNIVSATNCFVMTEDFKSSDFILDASAVDTWFHDTPPIPLSLDARTQAKKDLVARAYAKRTQRKPFVPIDLKPSQVPGGVDFENAPPLDTSRVAAFVTITDHRTGMIASSASAVSTSKEFSRSALPKAKDRYILPLMEGFGRRYANAVGEALTVALLDMTGERTNAINNLANVSSHRVNPKDGGASQRSQMQVVEVSPVTLAAELKTTNDIKKARVLRNYDGKRVRTSGYVMEIEARQRGERIGNVFDALGASSFGDYSTVYLLSVSPQPVSDVSRAYAQQVFICQLERDSEIRLGADRLTGVDRREASYSDALNDRLADLDVNSPVTVTGRVIDAQQMFQLVECTLE